MDIESGNWKAMLNSEGKSVGKSVGCAHPSDELTPRFAISETRGWKKSPVGVEATNRPLLVLPPRSSG